MTSLHFPFHVYVSVLHIQTTQGYPFVCANLAIDVRPVTVGFVPTPYPLYLTKYYSARGEAPEQRWVIGWIVEQS